MPYSPRAHWPRLLTLAAAGTCLAIFFVTFLHPIFANDLWWQMTLARYNLLSGHLTLDHTLFSWTPAENNSVYNSWIGGMLLYAVYEAGSVYGLLLVRYLSLGLMILLALLYARRRGITLHPLLWIGVTVAPLLTYATHAVKPTLFSISLLSLTVWLYYQMRALGERGWALAYGFPLILIVWVNTHGAFAIAAPFFIAIALGELLNHRLSPSLALPPRLRKHLLIGLLLCLPALLVNPYGYQLPLSIVMSSLNNPFGHIVATISEWLPTANYNIAPFYLLDYMLVAMGLFLLAQVPRVLQKRADWVAILSFIIFVLIYVKTTRMAPFLAPVFLFATLSALPGRDEQAPTARPQLALWLLTIVLFGVIAQRTFSNLPCTGLLGPEGALQGAARVTHKPDDVADYIEAHLPGTRIGNDYESGGYLMYRLWPERKVFIDARAFPYAAWYNDYRAAFLDEVKPEALLARFQADMWVVDNADESLNNWFINRPTWSPLFIGHSHTLYIPKAADAPPPALTLSPRIDTLHDGEEFRYLFGLAIQMQQRDLARQFAERAHANLVPTCPANARVLQDMDNSLGGLTALNAGDYLAAAEQLGRVASYQNARQLAAAIYRGLADDMISAGDYAKAKLYAVRAYQLFEPTTLIDLYNIAIIDWQLRQSTEVSYSAKDEWSRWEALAEHLEGKLKGSSDETPRKDPQSLPMREVIARMRAGTYQGEGHYLDRGK